MSVRFWKPSILNCLSALAHWPSLSHFVLIRSQQGTTRCDLRAAAAREWRDVLRVNFRQADPLRQPHMHPHLYISRSSTDSILKWTACLPGEAWSSLGGPLTPQSPSTTTSLSCFLSPHLAPTPPGIILRIYWLRWLLSILPTGAKAGNSAAYRCPWGPQPHFVGVLFPILSIILFFIN